MFQRGDKHLAFGGLFDCAFDGKIQGFGRVLRQHDVLRLAPEQNARRFAAVVQYPGTRAGKFMPASAGVAAPEICFFHRFKNPLAFGKTRSGVIEINHRSTPFLSFVLNRIKSLKY